MLHVFAKELAELAQDVEREFRREYYGEEMTLTVINEKTRELMERREQAAERKQDKADDNFSDPFQE